MHKYHLCGVSTTKETIYLRCRTEPDLIDMDLDAADPRVTGSQWWKIKYTIADAKPVTTVVSIGPFGVVQQTCTKKAVIQKVTLDDVLTAAMAESKAPIVIYASERALAEPVRPLPDALEVGANTACRVRTY